MSKHPDDAAKCAVCGKPAAAPLRPFCSARCADVDLGRWLTERYVVALDEAAGTTAEADG